jgi:hypothetical protein
MACSVHPDAKINLHRQSSRKLFPDNPSLWKLALHYVLALLKSKVPQFVPNFAHTQLSLSFLDLIIAMVDAGADVNAAITIGAYDTSRSGPLDLYAFEVIYQLLSRLWQARPSLVDQSKNASELAALARHNNLLVEKACHLEGKMRCQGCKISNTVTNGAGNSQPSMRYMSPSPLKLEIHPELPVGDIKNARDVPKLRRQKKQDTCPESRKRSYLSGKKMI